MDARTLLLLHTATTAIIQLPIGTHTATDALCMVITSHQCLAAGGAGFPGGQSSQIVAIHKDFGGLTAVADQFDLGALQPPVPANAALLLPQDHVSCLQVKTMVVAGTLSQGHTAALLIHEGMVRAATAFHRRKSLEAVGVTL